MKTSVTVNLGDVHVDASDTDVQLLTKAERHLPEALNRVGERVALEAWDAIQRELRGMISNSSSDKSSFIREKAAEYARNASNTYRREIVSTLVEELKKKRAAKLG
jgi:hypothetical protein